MEDKLSPLFFLQLNYPDRSHLWRKVWLQFEPLVVRKSWLRKLGQLVT